jgi:hypothetical protein
MDAKPGWKTTEFWLTLIASVIPFVSAVPLPQATVAAAALTGIYTIARGITKARAGGVSLHADDYKQITQTVADAVKQAIPARQ